MLGQSDGMGSNPGHYGDASAARVCWLEDPCEGCAEKGEIPSLLTGFVRSDENDLHVVEH